MYGNLGLSSESRVFTRGHGVEERASREPFLGRAWSELVPPSMMVVPHHGLTTSGTFVSDTGMEELPV